MSTKILRNYQIDCIDKIYSAWEQGAINILLQLPTGAGKTVIMSEVIKKMQGYSIAIAHRTELLSQLSLMLALNNVYHDIIAPVSTRKNIVRLHMSEMKQSFYRPGARCMVAGIDTLRRMDDPRFEQVELQIHDEGHHVLKKNKWGAVAEKFPRARGLFPTATPIRADGYGLGRHADGLIDVMISGISGRELIEQKYLTDYRIFAPPSDIDLSTVTISASGDYSPPKLNEAVKKSHIVGDVVAHYLRFARGKLGITFTASIDCASEIAAEYRKKGVPAEVISGNTPILLRASIMRKFKKREILQLVNVDILGEGVDVPAIEVVSMARPTQSFGLYCQQFGRALRPIAGKTHAIIIDHVGNVLRHGLPDAPRAWSLDRREKRSRASEIQIPLRTCLNVACLSVYERYKKCCPFCGHTVEPVERTKPEHVDGDLTELPDWVLDIMRRKITEVDRGFIPWAKDIMMHRVHVKRARERIATQADLRETIALWSGYERDKGLIDSEIYRKFYLMFGTDVMSAQTLNKSSASELNEKINNVLTHEGVVSSLTKGENKNE